jgi:hypothetical protein
VMCLNGFVVRPGVVRRTNGAKIQKKEPRLDTNRRSNTGEDTKRNFKHVKGFSFVRGLSPSRFYLRGFWGFLVFTRSRIGLSSSSSSTTYAPLVPSENVTINPSSPSGSVVSIRINSTVIKGVYSGSASKSVSFCSSR